MLKKISALLVAVMLITGVLLAEGQQESGGQPESEMVTLRVWDRVQEMGDVVDMFNAKMEAEGRNVRAEFELIPYEQQVPKFMSSLSAGTAPDIYSLDLVQYPYFISIGAFRDITEQYESLPFKDELPQGILELGTMEDRVYAMPYEIDLSHIVYNKDLFREAGLDPEQPPRTWEELREFAGELTVDRNDDGNPDQWGFAVVGANAGEYMFWFMPFVWNNGGSMFNNQGEVVFDSPESRESLQFFYDLIYEDQVAPQASAQWSAGDRYNAFVSGNLGIMLGGNFNITSILQDAPDLDFGVALMPRGNGDYATFGGGNMIGITTQSEHPDEAWEFIEFAYSEEALVEAYGQNMALIPRPSLYDNKYYQEIPQMQQYADFLAHAETPYTFNYNKIYDPVLFYLQGALLDNISVDEAIGSASEEIEKLVQ